MKITLLVLIETWLKTRSLKWRVDPETSMLKIGKDDPLDINLVVRKTEVAYTPTTFMDDSKQKILHCTDPMFFQNLEKVLKREEKWSNASKCIVLMFDGLMAVWGPMMNVVVPWIIDRIDDLMFWCGDI